MPGRLATPRRKRSPAPQPAARKSTPVHFRALLVIDHRRLQNAAWGEFHTARKRLEKATRDLHRHAEIDSPAYESWLHRTFPLLVTMLRELQEEANAKARKIKTVQAMAYVSGRSPNRLWREQRERELNPATSARESAFAEDEEELPPGAGADRGDLEPKPARSLIARDIFRRLVQRLHPDRGGAWTAARQRLWHEVQQAWAAGDTDWLSRLEVDWETANEVLGPDSPLSRLYRAIEELDAARRDTERTLREYRSSPRWRFTLTEAKRDVLYRRTEINLKSEIEYLRREVRHLNALIAAWEDDWTRADSRAHAGRRRRPRY
ncbi:MAG: hypothetical protein EXS38_09160 [Opitutus sp.]|nr:hypothetical protein [Opitutus sp.]